MDEREDGMEITGGCALHGAEVESYGDHRIAMSAAILGLFAEGETIIHDTDCVATSYPGFYETLQRVVKPGRTEEIPVISSLPVSEE